MGRLPLTFAGKPVSFRIPYSLAGELAVAPNTNGVLFPDATFAVQIDKPLEIHRVIIRLSVQGTPDGDSIPVTLEPTPTTMGDRVRLRISDFSKNENLTKTPTLVSTLLNRNTGAWDLEEPYTLVRSEGFQVQVDTLDFPTAFILNDLVVPEAVDIQFVRVEIDFQGYLIVIAPPSETR